MQKLTATPGNGCST